MSLTSIVLPVHNQAGHIGGVANGYLEALAPLPDEYELVLVPNNCSDETEEVCAALEGTHDSVRSVPIAEGGWGRAVKAGLQAAEGERLCYTNSARTSPEILTLMLAYSLAYKGAVLKANRRIRDSIVRRAGSVIYNMECRALLDLATWDINGTPKIFPREFSKLRGLSRDDDLIDAEFLAVCAREGYPVIEVPLLITQRHGGRSTTNLRSAARMYWGAFRLRSELGGGER
jgi:glycosyltransferase involved in cell wall biosynthesis